MSADVASLFFRSAGAPLISGNAVRVLLDAQENYPAWLAAIEGALRTIHLEMYIVHNDTIGRRFRDALIAKARAGVAVRLMCDWFGALRPSSFRFWAPLTAAGGQVRVVNPPRPDSLLGLGSRDHRKLLVIDGEVAFISGLCIGDDWVAIHNAASLRGATPVWRCVARRWPRPSTRLPPHGQPGAKGFRLEQFPHTTTCHLPAMWMYASCPRRRIAQRCTAWSWPPSASRSAASG